MLTPKQFKDRWQAEVVSTDPLPDDVRLVTVPADKLASLRLPQLVREYLTEVGLPKACAPCLSFDELGKGLPRLWDVFSPTQWRPNEKIGLEHYLMIGFDGSGNPFCIDERDGKVVLLEHELLFDTKNRNKLTMFVNSGIPQLAESLLLYQHSSPDAHRKALLEIDPPATQKGTFWSYEHSVPEDNQPPNPLQKLLFFRLGSSDSSTARWFWVLLSAAVGILLVVVLNRLLRR